MDRAEGGGGHAAELAEWWWLLVIAFGITIHPYEQPGVLLPSFRAPIDAPSG
jgi:hypothetical protein